MAPLIVRRLETSQLAAESMSLALPDELAHKALHFPESSYGATRVTLILSDGRRITDVILAGGVDIVRIGRRDIRDQSELGFRLVDIRDVRHQKRPTRSAGGPLHALSESMAAARWWTWPLIAALVVILIPIAIVGLTLWFAAAVLLQLVVWVAWCSRGRYALVVYSKSPIWQDYFEHHVIPAVGNRGIVLDWSERKRWPFSLSVVLFKFFGGTREFNPLALIFQPFAWKREFRFYAPFQAYKHGRPREVEEMRQAVLELLDKLAPEKITPPG
jgi:hypothetical protein